jgi:mannose-6-phosphate isomerase class I
MYLVEKEIRKTDQYELPVVKEERTLPGYDVYPVHSVGSGKILRGYESLAESLRNYHCIKLDGYVGTLFQDVRERLTQIFASMGIEPLWINAADALLPSQKIDDLLIPFLGGDDPVFGKVCPLNLIDLFDRGKLASLSQLAPTKARIFYGTGASLVPIDGKVVFFDVSKNEIQFRSRAGSVTNLGAETADDPKVMYKRFFFVDWPLLNRHVNSLKDKIDFYVDAQRSNEITWMHGQMWRDSISLISTRPIRVRPWFEPGAWGGTWIKDSIDGINTDAVNYAWSFELIVPENGVIIESDGLMLETTFDSLMFLCGSNILGIDFSAFGYLFPIRFDFLDTFNGGNLSVQCHPTNQYIQKTFGEKITQEETYYILDCQDNAVVYLGFQEGTTKEIFRSALEESQFKNVPIEIEKYVQVFPSNKHELFLIPPGTIHSSGKGNLVLEISSTPYIYTFKMYDWLRVDLDGKPRPMNIDRGMDNLVFERSGEDVAKELISRPASLELHANYEVQHLPTHQQHLYDVHRYVIKSEVAILTDGKAHVLNLVEGDQIDIVIDGTSFTYRYAETFVIPAAVKQYMIKNIGSTPAIVVKAFIK